MKAEILAPAGSFESLVAAVRSGADAVYFGTGDFNARRNADNFQGEEIKRAIDYCHLHSVKCHVALNTLVGDSELDLFAKTVQRVCALNADALILQDLAAVGIVKEICPETELHASTQLSTGTLEGIKLLSELGFKRAVLPRELSKKEIEYLCENSPIELECFVHGALCMSVSGQCLLSAMLGSRSGNRGLCAQPCRLPFKAENGNGHDLSLKDLSIIEEIPSLAKMGVCSFKIEGRMKRPEYVSAAVTACRESLDGTYKNERKDELKSLFSRSGFTDGYYRNKRSPVMFGTRQKEDVVSASDALLKQYRKLYEKEIQTVGADFVFSAGEGKHPTLTAEAKGQSVFTESDFITEAALNKALSEDAVASQLSKCGGTAFYPNSIKCEIQGEVSVPASVINALRREALAELEKEIIGGERKVGTYTFKEEPETKVQTPELWLSFRDINQIPESIEADRIFLPLNTDNELIDKYSAGVIIPRGLFYNSDLIFEKLKSSGAKYALCNTLDAVALAKRAKKEIIGGPFLNIFNSVSLSKAKQLGIEHAVLSYELLAQRIKEMRKCIKTGAVIYGRTPLMLTANCPLKNGRSCEHCDKKGYLTDRKSVKFPVVCSNGFSEVLNSRPTYMLDKTDAFGDISFYMLEFTTESRDKIKEIINAYHIKKEPEGEFTRGLYFRGVE